MVAPPCCRRPQGLGRRRRRRRCCWWSADPHREFVVTDRRWSDLHLAASHDRAVPGVDDDSGRGRPCDRQGVHCSQELKETIGTRSRDLERNGARVLGRRGAGAERRIDNCHNARCGLEIGSRSSNRGAPDGVVRASPPRAPRLRARVPYWRRVDTRWYASHRPWSRAAHPVLWRPAVRWGRSRWRDPEYTTAERGGIAQR